MADADEGIDRAIELLARMRGADLGADARLSLRDDREEEADRIDAFLQQALGEALGQRCVVEHHGTDRMHAVADVEPGIDHAGTEMGGVLAQSFAQLACR